jgi:site-specific DNA recombinase
VRLYVDADKITDHKAQEPFDTILGGYRLGHAWQRNDEAQANISAAPPEEYGADLQNPVVPPSLALAGHVSSKTNRVELRGFEPLTPTLPVWCATSCATAPERGRLTPHGVSSTVPDGRRHAKSGGLCRSVMSGVQSV